MRINELRFFVRGGGEGKLEDVGGVGGEYNINNER